MIVARRFNAGCDSEKPNSVTVEPTLSVAEGDG